MVACMVQTPAHADSGDVSPVARPSVRQETLDNGLQLVWEEDHRQPLVAIEARINGGLRGEGPSVGTGVTHFIEHMLFKGTTTRAPGTIEQEVRRYGGTINAFTSFDTTGVSLFVESKSLKDALEMLSDILRHAVFDQTEFEKERAVILSELQMNLDNPDRRIHHIFWGRHLLQHPYRHPILGYRSLLERLTVKDLTDFYAAQYQPQQITIACVGDLDGASFPALAQAVFGEWPRGKTDPLQLLVPAEPPAASAKEAVVELPVQAAYVMLGFASTRLSDPDLYPLDVLANILGDGRSSRFYETLVRKRQLAHAISAWNYTPQDPGVFAIQFRTDPEKVAPAIEAVRELLNEVRGHGVTEAELRKAKRSVTADHLFALQTIEAKAADLVNSLAATGHALFSERYVDGINRVSLAEVQRVAQRYCDPQGMTTAVLRPRAARPPAAIPAAAPVRMSKTMLPNGTTTLIGVDASLPIAAIVVAFRGGVRVEPEGRPGLSNLVAQLLTKGTTRRSAQAIAQHVESLGGSLEPFSGRDGFGLVLQVLAQDLPDGLELMHELVTQSTFPEAELSLQRALISKQLQAQEDEIFEVGGRLLRQTLFEHHPYRFHPLGDRSVVETFTRQECLAFAKRWLAPSNSVVAVFGDVDAKGLTRRLAQTFGATPSSDAPWPDRLVAEPLEQIRSASQTMDREQALIMLGFRGSTHAAEDRYAVDVLTAVLSGMSGRLFQAVREKHGLSYTLGAVHVPGWDPGYLLVYAATRPAEEGKVLGVIDEQLGLVLEQGVADEEIEQAKRYLVGVHRLDIQHLVGLAKRSAIDELYGLGYSAWSDYEAKINAVTGTMVHAAARRYLSLQRRAQVVISPNGHSSSP